MQLLNYFFFFCLDSSNKYLLVPRFRHWRSISKESPLEVHAPGGKADSEHNN